MVSKLALILVFFIGLISVNTLAQDQNLIDSLKGELPKCKNAADSVDILCRLAWEISSSKKPKKSIYGILALEKISRLNDSVLIANTYDAAALTYRLDGNLKKAEELYQISLNIGLRNRIPDRIAWSSFHLETISLYNGDIKRAEKHAQISHKNYLITGNYRKAFDAYWELIYAGQDQYMDTLSECITNYLPNLRDDTERLFVYLQLVNLYNLKEDRNKAMHYVQQAMELAEKNKNTQGIVKAYYSIAEYFSNIQQNYSMALTYYEKIYDLLDTNKKKNKGDIYNQIGDMHRLLGNDSLALSYFNKALETGKTFNHRHTKASAYMKLGDISYQHNEYQEALDYYLKCYETNCDVCPRIKFHDVLVNIGNVYLFSGDTKNAGKYYQLSLELADSSRSDRAKCNSLMAFASLTEKKGDLNSAIKYATESLNLAKSNSFLEGQLLATEKLSKLYKKSGNFQQAYLYLAQANSLSDSLQKANEIDNLAKLETYFDFKNIQIQRELDETKSSKEISHQKLLRNFFIIGFILVILLVILTYLSYRRKQKANQELKKQKEEIEVISKKLHNADQAKLQFYTNLSHEFKTPLTLILGVTEKLKSEINNNKQLNIIRKNSLKLLQLINHLLDLRKIDTHKMGLEVKQGNIVDFLHGITGSFENFANQKEITLKFESKESEVDAWFDHDKLEKVFSNLVSNALKYSRKNGWVLIKTKKQIDGFFEINVTDNGVGIQEKELKNIFNRFYRIPGSSSEGSGIGLALVKEMVEVHKGNVTVEGKRINGASFTVRIPIEKHFYNENEIAKDNAEINSWSYIEAIDLEDETRFDETIAGNARSNKKSILIVEDNYDLRRFIAEMFSDTFDTLEACDGSEGVKLAIEFVPDIVISDVMMPNMSGIELVESLRKNVATSHIPIILLTAKNDLNTHLSSLNKGVDDFISKPFDSQVLKSRVDNLLRLRQQIVEKFSKEFKLQPREITIENADQKFLQKTIDIIETHISNPNLNVELLAIELCVSRTQLYRKLNALIDYSPKHFIRIIRLKRAAQILEQGQNNIAEIMDATGFSNYSYFNNCFKDFFGKYPKEYAIASVSGSLN